MTGPFLCLAGRVRIGTRRLAAWPSRSYQQLEVKLAMSTTTERKLRDLADLIVEVGRELDLTVGTPLGQKLAAAHSGISELCVAEEDSERAPSVDGHVLQSWQSRLEEIRGAEIKAQALDALAEILTMGSRALDDEAGDTGSLLAGVRHTIEVGHTPLTVSEVKQIERLTGIKAEYREVTS